MKLYHLFLSLMLCLLIVGCKKDGDSNIPDLQQRYAHFSVDDVLEVMMDLSKDDYDSIFEHDFFDAWKKLHDQYDITLTLNLYHSIAGFDLSQMTNKYKSEFSANSHWLKFSFHAGNNGSNYNTSTNNTEALKHYNDVYQSIENFAGLNSINRFCRFHFFSANKELLQEMQESAFPLLGIHTADDDRDLNSGLTVEELEILNMQTDYYDETNRLYYIQSEPRLDTLSVLTAIEYLENNIKSNSDYHIHNYFLHEQNVIKQFELLDSLSHRIKLEGIRFDFPSNNIPS